MKLVILCVALISLVAGHEFHNYLGRPSLEANTTTNATADPVSKICKIKFFAYD